MNPYRHLVSQWAGLVDEGKALPLGGFDAERLPGAAAPDAPAADAPRVLIFAPHPDDECLVGALPLRLLRQARMNVINVAVTLGSNRDRQAARLAELTGACRYLGFGLALPRPGGLSRVNPATRANDPSAWRACVDSVAEILKQHQPQVVVFPHVADWNSTHIGTHHLVMDALARQPAGFATHVVQTEYWGAMTAPNLMVESGVADVADLVAATSFHAGEVRRNPYHLLLPSWMQDNVRRGGELVGGQGGAVPDFRFATLYHLSRWCNGGVQVDPCRGRLLAAADSPIGILSWGRAGGVEGPGV